MNEKKDGLQTIHELFASRLPILIWVSLVYAATVVLQYLKEPLILPSIVFTGLFTVHVLLYWSSHRVTQKQFWFYYSAQAILIYLCAILMPRGYQAVLIGLLPVLIAHSLGFSFRTKRVVFVALISIVIFFDSALTVGDTDELVLFLPLFILMLIIVLAYAILFFQQVRERIRIQSYLRDLQEAHRKVEELTLANERQRMARDLHDTLAQGVAGLIMRLEAADAHMSQGRVERAHDIVKQSMQQARTTLAEARRAIDNLRAKSASEIDFKEAIEDEVQHFRDATGIEVSLDLDLHRRLSRVLMEHSLHMVAECLTNIARHAKANKAWVTVSDRNERLWIEIRDNGVGFNTDEIGIDTGHYGLLGMKERVRLIGGEMEASSTSEGTSIKIKTSIIEGEPT
ncbi:sensor histidine kinase [Gorillibacterium timonense]|uniref:sensor histidine kinase n=1 Tax=Gorillibacterium timonense TaxID=1689269 RepID=UPI00071DBA7D|nr:sensor histidine kinase [Gorillibacterium timonense]